MHVPMCGQGSGQELLPKAYLEKGPRLGHPSVRVPFTDEFRVLLLYGVVFLSVSQKVPFISQFPKNARLGYSIGTVIKFIFSSHAR